MDINPRTEAELILAGKKDFPNDLTFDLFEDIVRHIQRILEGNDGYQMLISESSIPVLKKALLSEGGTTLHRLALEQLSRCGNEKKGFTFLTSHPELLQLFIRPLIDEFDISGSEIVSSTIVAMCKNFAAEMEDILFSKTSSTCIFLETHLLSESSSSLLRIRILDMFANISSLSNKWFDAVKSKQILDLMIKELDNDDLLSQLNSFQIIGKLCSSQKGNEFAEQHGIQGKLLSKIDLENPTETLSMYLTNIITLVGEMASISEHSFESWIGRHLEWIHVIHSNLEANTNDEVIQSCIFALARLCLTNKGLDFLLHKDQSILLRDWLEYGLSSNAELKATAFYSLSIILDSKRFYQSHDPNLPERLQLLYSKMGFQDFPTLEVLHKNLTGSMEELKLASLTLIKSTLHYKWGLEELIRFPGLTDWLLDRSTENTKKGHDMKYDVIRTAIDFPDSKDVLGTAHYHNFLEYLKLGVYYSKAQSETLVKDDYA